MSAFMMQKSRTSLNYLAMTGGGATGSTISFLGGAFGVNLGLAFPAVNINGIQS